MLKCMYYLIRGPVVYSLKTRKAEKSYRKIAELIHFPWTERQTQNHDLRKFIKNTHTFMSITTHNTPHPCIKSIN